MPSQIDPTKPISGTPTTQSVRDNFSAAKSEIEVLQTKEHDQNKDQYLDQGGANESTAANVKNAVDKKHTQGTDTALGVMSADVNMNTHKLTGLSAPGSAGDSLRQTATLTESAAEDAVSKKHSQNTDIRIQNTAGDTKVEVNDSDEVIVTANGNQVLKSVSSGILHIGKQSACSVYRDTSVQSVPTGEWTKVQFNGEEYDIQGEFDSTTNYRFVATETGKYSVKAAVELVALAANAALFIAIYKNGGKVRSGNIVRPPIAADSTATIVTDINLAANDYLEIFIYHNHGSNRDIWYGSSETYFQIHKFA